MKWSMLLMLAGCSVSAAPPTEPVVIERVVVVERIEVREPAERFEPGDPIPESPLLVASDEHRASRAAEMASPEPEREIVYVPILVERSGPRRLSMLERQQLERELVRCNRRATKWARERCEERARAR